MFMARDKSESSFQLRKSMCLHVTASFLNVIFAEELLWSKPSKAWNVCEISETPSTILVLLGSAIHCIHLWNTWIISNYFVNFLAFFWHNFGTGEFSRSEAHRPENSNFQDVKTFPVVTPWQTLADTWSQGPRNKESKPQMEMNVVWIARIAKDSSWRLNVEVRLQVWAVSVSAFSKIKDVQWHADETVFCQKLIHDRSTLKTAVTKLALINLII